MLLETCRLARKRVGDRLLCCRVSIFNKLDEGFTPGDLRELVAELRATGLDMLDVSTDGAFNSYFGAEKTLGQWVKEMVPLPIIVAGGLGDPRDAERAVARGHADFAAVGRGMLDDPGWARTAFAKLEER